MILNCRTEMAVERAVSSVCADSPIAVSHSDLGDTLIVENEKKDLKLDEVEECLKLCGSLVKVEVSRWSERHR